MTLIYRSKFITWLNIIAVFNKLRIYLDKKDLITFMISLESYKYRVLPLSFMNDPVLY